MDTYFEVQLTAPGVTSYGAVWMGFPVLRQCFTEFVAWTQTTNGPTGADVYRLTFKATATCLTARRRPFEVEQQVIKVRQADGIAARRAAHHSPVGTRTGLLRPPWCHCCASCRPGRSTADVRAVLAHGPGEELRPVARRDAHAAAADLPHDVRRSRRSHHVRVQRGPASARARRLRLLERRRPWRSISPHRRRPDRALRRAAAGDRSPERMGAEQQRFAVDVHLSGADRSRSLRPYIARRRVIRSGRNAASACCPSRARSLSTISRR